LFTQKLFVPGEPQEETVATERSKNPFSILHSKYDIEETAQPHGIATELFPHQKQALKFMIRRERGWDFSATGNDIWMSHVDAFGTTRYKNTVSGVTRLRHQGLSKEV